MSVVHTAHGHIRRIDFALVADASGAFAVEPLPPFSGTLLALRSGDEPWDGVAPTPDWSVEVFDQHGLDILEGCGLNRSASTVTGTVIRFSNTDLHPVVIDEDSLRLKISGNLAPFAQISLTIFYGMGYVA